MREPTTEAVAHLVFDAQIEQAYSEWQAGQRELDNIKSNIDNGGYHDRKLYINEWHGYAPIVRALKERYESLKKAKERLGGNS